MAIKGLIQKYGGRCGERLLTILSDPSRQVPTHEIDLSKPETFKSQLEEIFKFTGIQGVFDALKRGLNPEENRNTKLDQLFAFYTDIDPIILAQHNNKAAEAKIVRTIGDEKSPVTTEFILKGDLAVNADGVMLAHTRTYVNRDGGLIDTGYTCADWGN